MLELWIGWSWEALKGLADQLLVQLLLEALDHWTHKGQCFLLVLGAEALCEALLAGTNLDEVDAAFLSLEELRWAGHLRGV